MSWVKTKCAHCRGRLQVASHDVLLTVHTSQSWRDTYRFFCALCREENVYPAGVDVVELLVSASVRIERVQVPDELDDASRRAPRPLTWDDLLDFLDALETTEDLKALWRA